MIRALNWMGFTATTAIVLLLAVNIIYEPERQRLALETYQETAVAQGMYLYAENCARCHGAAGEGLGVYRALNQLFIASKNPRDLHITIQYGRYATDMAAFGLEEGGSLTPMQINNIVLMLQTADWDAVQARVEALGKMPTEADIEAAQSASLDVVIHQQPVDSDLLERTLSIFVENCSECHGEQGGGTADAPELNNAYVRGMSGSQLAEIITLGVRNTNMAGFEGLLSTDVIADLVLFLQNWDQQGGAAQAVTVIASEAEIAAVTETGEQLFGMWCGVCHGVRGEGGAIAPSLNDIPYLPADFLVSRIRNGKNAMPPFPEENLSNGQVAVVIDYAQTAIIGSGLPSYSDAELTQGKDLYTAHCAECHGEVGEGITDAGPRINTLPPMRASEIINFTRVGSANTPAIPVSEVPDVALRLIVAYIHSLSQE